MAEETKKVEKTKSKKFEPKDNVTKVDMSSFRNEEPIDDVIKVDLSKPPPTPKNEEVEKQPVEEEEVVVVNPEPKVEKEEVVEEQKEEQPTLQEITDEEELIEELNEAVIKSEATGKPLPEKVEKLINFMNETGGDLQDYVNLNKDISKMDNSEILDEYYRATKSHLTPEERSFLLEDSFGYDEDEDDPKEIRKKKIALKEQVAEARAHLDRQKSKYYEDIKAGSKLTEEQQKAIDFFNRSEEQKKQTEASKRTFLNKTDSFFGQDFKGFEYNVGDKRYRFNVKDVDKVKTTQSDINNFVSKFTNKDNSTIEDAAGYHKSLFTAMNPDAIAKHFYEQGKADAIKDRVAKDKNINLEPRKMHNEYEAGGLKVKVLGQSSSDIKNRSFKIRKKN